jgi:hypothetical protein
MLVGILGTSSGCLAAIAETSRTPQTIFLGVVYFFSLLQVCGQTALLFWAVKLRSGNSADGKQVRFEIIVHAKG